MHVRRAAVRVRVRRGFELPRRPLRERLVPGATGVIEDVFEDVFALSPETDIANLPVPSRSTKPE